MRSVSAFPPQTHLPSPLLFLALSSRPLPGLWPRRRRRTRRPRQEQEKPVKITEEIQVVGKAPKDVPLATVTTVDATDIAELKPRDLADVVKYIPGSMVTFGDKDTYTLKLRGIGSNRIALLVDGVPVYEPYFCTFDLKTVSAGGIDTLQVTKGPSSVLYGPNTLGGCRQRHHQAARRAPIPLRSPGATATRTRAAWGRRLLRLEAFLARGQRPLPGLGRFSLPRPGERRRTLRANSDFERLNLNGKLYYTPSSPTEIMVNGGILPVRVRHAAGPVHPEGPLLAFPEVGPFDPERGRLHLARRRLRPAFPGLHRQLLQHPRLVQRPGHDRPRLVEHLRQLVLRRFRPGRLPTGDRNTLKASLLYQKDIARIQDDAGLPWERSTRGRSRPESRTSSA